MWGYRPLMRLYVAVCILLRSLKVQCQLAPPILYLEFCIKLFRFSANLVLFKGASLGTKWLDSMTAVKQVEKTFVAIVCCQQALALFDKLPKNVAKVRSGNCQALIRARR